MDLNALDAAIQDYTAVIKQKIENSNRSSVVLTGNVIVPSTSRTKVLDIKALLGEPASNYNFFGMTVQVTVTETVTGDDFNGYNIPPDATLRWGLRSDGKVLLVNDFSDDVTAAVVVTVPHVDQIDNLN
jgi:hypothetical protein